MTPGIETSFTVVVFAEVLFPLALRKPLIYSIPSQLVEEVSPGRLVVAPLGRKKSLGCVLRLIEKTPAFATKDILEVRQDILLSPAQIKMLQWSAAYYLTTSGEVLRHFLPPQYLGSASGKCREGSFATKELHEGLSLNTSQQKVLERIREDLKQPTKPFLLQGVTGSGKTEVYIEATREVVRLGGQALILVPEIGLTPQILERFSRSLDSVVACHSAMTEKERRLVWESARSGKAKIIIATRSGIFLPFQNLRLIVVDEEHDSSYKQEERFCYHARDLALWKAHEEKITIVLGSATPSLESLHRVREGRMELLRMETRAVGRPPEIRVIDRRLKSKNKNPSETMISEELCQAIYETLRRKEQVLLFLNRRGFSPFVLCQSCGHVPECPDCDIALSLHHHSRPGGANKGHGEPEGRGHLPSDHWRSPRFARDDTPGHNLMCHYCDQTLAFSSLCPQCHEGLMGPIGAGTERIVHSLQKQFPSARIERLDRDASKGREWSKILNRMKRHETDILVGTQMITKGHDYPDLTLVGILDADQSLHIPDFRATERTYQLITQVAGRTGRSEKPGRVFLQTYQPDHRGIRLALNADLEVFLKAELQEREEAGYPPFQRLVEIRLSGVKRVSVMSAMEKLRGKLQEKNLSDLATLLGPAPCGIERLRNRYRWHVLLKTHHYTKIHSRLQALLDDFAENDLRSGLRMLVNVDPVEMM